MRPQRTGDEAQASRKQEQHDQGVEEAGGLEVHAQVHEDAQEDDRRSAQGDQPSDHALAVEEEDADAEDEGQQ